VSLWQGEAYLDKPASAEALIEAIEDLLTEEQVAPD
jgi:hypothetical protein